jgi:hypothetical protein
MFNSFLVDIYATENTLRHAVRLNAATDKHQHRQQYECPDHNGA